MDREEFKIKMNQINHLVEEQKYKEAMEVVDSIDWRRVKKVKYLYAVGEIYAANKRYEDSKEIFLLAYHRAPIGKNILYRLIEVSLKMNDIQEAEEFYEEYLEIAPNDSTHFILRYKISKAANAPAQELIRILEEYKEREFTEKWSYELARLYYQQGETKKALDICDEIILWFSEGRYVMKAMDLKNRMGQLTGAEKEKYDQQLVSQLSADGAAVEDDADSAAEDKSEAAYEEEIPVIETVRIDDRDLNSVESLQEKISKGIRDIFNSKKKEDDEFSLDEEELVGDTQEEMIRDIASEENQEDVPELEPEASGEAAEEEAAASEEVQEEIPEEEISEEELQETAEEEAEEITAEAEDEFMSEEASETPEMKMPELEIPESLKNIGAEEQIYAEIPKAPDIVLPSAENEAQEEEEKEFNLEDMILSAATEQGIEIPKESAVKETVSEEEDEDSISEEDLQSAEDEFLNGPADIRDEEEERGEDSFEDDELEDDDFYEDEDDDSYDDFYDEDEEEDFDEDDFEDEEDDEFYEDEDEDEEDDFYTAKVRKPDSARKTVFREEAASRRPKRRLTEEEELERFVDSIHPQEPMDIIPRQKKLTENEKKLFTYFAKVPGLREQLLETLCDVQMAAADKTSRTGNIIVMGGRETGKTRLISSLIPAICKELNIEAAKVAYVFAEQINGKNIPAIVKKMSGGFLVIENANKLKKETVNQLSKAMEFRTDGMIVILEDEKIGMRKLMARFPKFTTKFTSLINIPVFTNDELVNFAKVYTRERGYTIDSHAMLSLYNLISTNQKDDQPMNVGAVKEIIDNAISRSTGGIRKLSRNISKKRTDADGYVVLYDRDFN